MMVHAVIALAWLAAATFLFRLFDLRWLSFTPETWKFLTGFSLVMLLVLSLPSALSGVFERGHQYANWHRTHKIKLILTIVLCGFLIVELIWLIGTRHHMGSAWPAGLLIVLGNTGVVTALSAYGLKMTLGRQSLGTTSYEPDLFKAEPVDILISAGVLMKEEPKYVDLLEER
jgi:hypothetical protein